MKLKKMILILFPIIAVIFLFMTGQKEEPSIRILTAKDQHVAESNFIYNHPDAILFPAVVRSSGQKPVETSYKGIELSKLFSSLDIELSNIEKVTFNAADGYRVILSIEELKEPGNTYLTFERNGAHLKSKKQGGSGPFQLVIRRDPFSQRWIKHVDEIILE
ncbi:hypothetical protein [Geosporobacter ferrireducens]|uniref:hypothetical protein n=1 Tax=Geosporobacter ferrireducens TaxID=1424294 RepID=UPI00139B2841|nr:hypothetical protein [Geosporobacter ferrireducens]MTI54747.1 hypothetical protein [Geosporobacter ferrireducens]